MKQIFSNDIYFLTIRTFLKSHGVYVDDSTSTQIDEAFHEVLTTMMHEPGEASKHLTIRLSLGLCKKLELKGAQGDISMLARKVGISHHFAAKILRAFLAGNEDALFVKKRKSTAIQETEWPAKFKEFVFQPQFARAVPG